MIKTESPAQLTLRILAQKTFDEVVDFLEKLSTTMLPTNVSHDEYMDNIRILQTVRVPMINALGWTSEEFEAEINKRAKL